ncbi:MAG: hypothetical protein RL375_1470 [Pseudomonadota bacterium]|jgi:hypothetical protein
MKHHIPALGALAATALLMAAPGAQAAFVTPTLTGVTTLSICSPKLNLDTPTEQQNPATTTCRVEGLPGSAAVPGYIQRAARSAPIVVNGVTIGTLYDRVWCLGTGTTCNATNTYILGMRINLNTAVWKATTPFSFEVNDMFRAVRAATSADIAYFNGTVVGGTLPDTAAARKFLEYSGRTIKGLFEPSAEAQQFLNKARNNAWMDFRVDVNANDPDATALSPTSPWSPWVFVRQVCPTGFNATPQPLKIRLRQGGEEGQLAQEILTSGYVCN